MPSEYAPLSSAMLADIFYEASFPPGTVNMVTEEGDVGRALVEHPDVSAVVFTGSTKTGEAIAAATGLKKRVLELGGNGPIVVRADADLDRAADAAIVGCYCLAGQCCTAAERGGLTVVSIIFAVIGGMAALAFNTGTGIHVYNVITASTPVILLCAVVYYLAGHRLGWALRSRTGSAADAPASLTVPEAGN